MRFSDVWLLFKKILVGVIVTVVPLAILAGGLWITQKHLASRVHPAQASTSEANHAN